jgi:hypothetical protein
MRKTPVSRNAFRGLFRRKAFGVDFQSLKKAAATRSQAHGTLRRLLDSQTRSSEYRDMANPGPNQTKQHNISISENSSAI